MAPRKRAASNGGVGKTPISKSHKAMAPKRPRTAAGNFESLRSKPTASTSARPTAPVQPVLSSLSNANAPVIDLEARLASLEHKATEQADKITELDSALSKERELQTKTMGYATDALKYFQNLQKEIATLKLSQRQSARIVEDRLAELEDVSDLGRTMGRINALEQ